MVLALVINIGTKINVQPPVSVKVGQRHGGEVSLRGLSKTEGVWLQAKLSLPLVEEEERATGSQNDKILITVIVNVAKQGAGSIVEDTDFGRLGDVLEGSVSAIPVQPVRKAGWLAHIEVVKAVVINVCNGQAVVAVDIDAAGSIQECSPVVGPMKHLLGI